MAALAASVSGVSGLASPEQASSPSEARELVYPDPSFDGVSGNCYSYARNDPWNGPYGAGHPAEQARVPAASLAELGVYFVESLFYDCNGLVDAQRRDGAIDPIKTDDGKLVCPDSTHLVNMRTATRNLADLVDIHDPHALRQNANGDWSHKPGLFRSITDKDASGKKITNPDTADLNYYAGLLNYDKSCSYLCHPSAEQPKRPEPSKGKNGSGGFSSAKALATTIASVGAYYVLGRPLMNKLLDTIDPLPQADAAGQVETAASAGGATSTQTAPIANNLQQRVLTTIQQSAAGMSRTALKKEIKGVKGQSIDQALASLETTGLIKQTWDSSGNRRFVAAS